MKGLCDGSEPMGREAPADTVPWPQGEDRGLRGLPTDPAWRARRRRSCASGPAWRSGRPLSSSRTPYGSGSVAAIWLRMTLQGEVTPFES